MEKMVDEIKREITFSVVIIIAFMGFLFFCTMSAMIESNDQQQKQYEEIIKKIEKHEQQ